MITEKIDRQQNERAEGGGTILIVEDEELLRDLVEQFLTESGYRVLTAGDGLNGVQYYRMHRNEIRVVLLDIELPMLSGPDAFQRMKEMNPDIRVIFASGSLNPSLKRQLQEAGAKRFVQKPYGPAEILKTIREVLQEKRR